MRMRLTLGRRAGFLLVSLLLTVGIAAAPLPDTRLVDALQHQDNQAARALLKQGIDVNSRAADGATAIQWAAHWNDMEMTELLIKAGADVNAPDDHGMSALSLACENVSSRMVE